MRLAIIVTEFPKATETFILRDLMEFHRRGHELRIYALTTPRRAELLHGFAQETAAWVQYRGYADRKSLSALGRALLRQTTAVIQVTGVLIRELWREPVLLLKSLAILPKSLSFAEDVMDWNADHVHAEFAGHPATSAWMIGRLTATPYSVSCRAHDIFVSQALLAQKLSEAAFVRCISEYNVRFLQERALLPPTKPIFVIHSSLDVQGIPPLPPPQRGNVFHVLYVGSLFKRKGVDVLLRALAALEFDWHLEIIGRGSAEPVLRALAKSLGIQQRIEFRGPQPFEEVSVAYGHANVVVAPSIIGPSGRTEGIPNVVIEALAHCRPVISTCISGIPELVEHKVTGLLVKPGDVRALADSIEWVHQNPEEADALARQGRQRVEAEFCLSTNVTKQLDAFARFSTSAVQMAAAGS